jgi:hypothetical protein
MMGSEPCSKSRDGLADPRIRRRPNAGRNRAAQARDAPPPHPDSTIFLHSGTSPQSLESYFRILGSTLSGLGATVHMNHEAS